MSELATCLWHTSQLPLAFDRLGTVAAAGAADVDDLLHMVGELSTMIDWLKTFREKTSP
jgi:hypothetical protein